MRVSWPLNALHGGVPKEFTAKTQKAPRRPHAKTRRREGGMRGCGARFYRQDAKGAKGAHAEPRRDRGVRPLQHKRVIGRGGMWGSP